MAPRRRSRAGTPRTEPPPQLGNSAGINAPGRDPTIGPVDTRSTRPITPLDRLRHLLVVTTAIAGLAAWVVPLFLARNGTGMMPGLRHAGTAIVDAMTPLRPVVWAMVVACVLSEAITARAWLQRRRLVRQITRLLRAYPSGLAVTVWPGVRSPRRGTVPIMPGHVFTDSDLVECEAAMSSAWRRRYTVRHDAARDRILVRRIARRAEGSGPAEPVYVSDAHRRLDQVREQLPITVTAIEPDTRPGDDGADRVALTVRFEPTPNATVAAWQQRVGNALLQLIGPSDTGTRWQYTWKPDQDLVVLEEKPAYVDAVHERLDTTSQTWPITVLDLRPVPETMWDGTPSTSYLVRHAATTAVTAEAWRVQTGRQITGLVGTTERGTRFSAQWEPAHDQLWLREVPELPRYLPHPIIPDDQYADFLGERPGELLLGLGMTDRGVPAVWNISPSCGTPHALIVGGTGAGKTTAERTAIVSALRRNVPVILIDPKSFELIQFAGTPGVLTIASEPDHIASVFEALTAEMVLREQSIARNELDNANLDEVPPFILACDEYFVLSALMTQWTREQNVGLPNNDPRRVRNPLDGFDLTIVRIRAVNGRLLIVSQFPHAEQWANAGVRDNLGSRLAMARLSRIADDMMFDGLRATQDIDASIPGRGMIKMLAGDLAETQVWWTPKMDQRPKTRAGMSEADRMLADALRPTWDIRHGLFLPASAAEPLLRTPAALRPVGAGTSSSSTSAITLAKTGVYARDVRPRMRVLVDLDGELAPATVLDVEEDEDRVEIEVQADGEKTPRVVDYSRDEVIGLLSEEPEAD